MSFPYILQGSNITVVIGTTPHTVSKTHPTYQKVVDAVKAEDWDTVQALIEPKQAVLDYGQGNISIEGTKLFWKGKPFNNALAAKIVEMLNQDFPIEPMVKFMENLMENPSRTSVEELYGFLEVGGLPITSDGCFLAYKKVRADYTDCHTGKISNAVGEKPEMERNEVDDNRNKTCSEGLHFCSKGYLSHFGGERTMIVKINPRDVVSIPSDYNDTKGRACTYEVVDEIDKDKVDEALAKAVQDQAERDASLMTDEDLANLAKLYKAAGKLDASDSE